MLVDDRVRVINELPEPGLCRQPKLMSQFWSRSIGMRSRQGRRAVNVEMVLHLAPRVKRTVAWLYPLVQVGLVNRWISAQLPLGLVHAMLGDGLQIS